MSEKESTASVMRISVSFTELVMDSVISAPLVNVVLRVDGVMDHLMFSKKCEQSSSFPYLDSNGLCHSRKQTKWPLGLVASVSPQSMGTARDSEPAEQKQEECCKINNKSITIVDDRVTKRTRSTYTMLTLLAWQL